MLSKIQSELKAPKNHKNKFGNYNYRTCEDILEAVKPLLEAHGGTLTISDEIKSICDIIYVEATVTYKNGEEVITVTSQAGIEPNKKGMDIAQSFGASSSYARKYALNGLFLIDDTKDSDSTNTVSKTNTVSTPNIQESEVLVKKGIYTLLNQITSVEGLTKLANEKKAARGQYESVNKMFSDKKEELLKIAANG